MSPTELWSGPPEDLIVNLSRADGDVVLPVRRLLLHLREEQLQGPLINAWVLGGPLMAEGKAQWPYRCSHSICHPMPPGTLQVSLPMKLPAACWPILTINIWVFY